MVFRSVLFKDFKIIWLGPICVGPITTIWLGPITTIWLGPINMVTVYNVTMVTLHRFCPLDPQIYLISRNLDIYF